MAKPSYPHILLLPLSRWKWLQKKHSSVLEISRFCCYCSVVSDSLQPHGLQHARLLCPSLSPKVCSNSCPLSWWCQLPLNTSLDRALPIRGTRPSSTHQWACQTLQSESLNKPLGQPHPPGGWQLKQEEQLQPCSLQNRDCNHRKLYKMKWQRSMFQMKEQDKA